MGETLGSLTRQADRSIVGVLAISPPLTSAAAKGHKIRQVAQPVGICLEVIVYREQRHTRRKYFLFPVVRITFGIQGRVESAFCSTACFDSPGDPLRTVMAEAG
jgi:hypothetical protein